MGTTYIFKDVTVSMKYTPLQMSNLQYRLSKLAITNKRIYQHRKAHQLDFVASQNGYLKQL